MNSTLLFEYSSNFAHPCPLFGRNVALTNQKDEETNAQKKFRRILMKLNLARTPMKRILGASLTLAVSAALLVLASISQNNVPTVHAQSGCSERTLNPNDGFTFDGFQIQHGTQRSVPFYGAGLASSAGAVKAST